MTITADMVTVLLRHGDSPGANRADWVYPACKHGRFRNMEMFRFFVGVVTRPFDVDLHAPIIYSEIKNL